jgi:hypothetical protein
MKLRQHRFKNAGQLIDFMVAEELEDYMVETLQKARPLRSGDQLHRLTHVVDGKCFWYSVVFRSTGAVEIWRQLYDPETTAATHEGNWKLIANTKGDLYA